MFRLLLAGRPTDLTAPPSEAAELALDAARAFLTVANESGRNGAWRVAAIDDGATRVAALLGGISWSDGRPGPAAGSPALGTLTQSDGRTAVTVLPPLGRLDLPTLRELGTLLRGGRDDARISQHRTLTLVDVPPTEAGELAEALAELGFIVSEQSGWWGLSACAGVGACVRARVDVRAAAMARAHVRPAGAPAEHWSACERGCGRPPGVPVAVTAEDLRLGIQLRGISHYADDVPEALNLLDALREHS